MSAWTPILWLPESACAAMAKALQAGLGAWSEHWGLSSPTVGNARALTHRDAPVVLAEAEGSLDVAHGGVHLGGQARLGALLAKQFFGLNQARPGLSTVVVEEVAASFNEALVNAFGKALALPTQALPDVARFSPGHWGAACTVSWNGLSLHLAIAAPVLEACGWLPKVASTPLKKWDPEAVLSHLTLKLVAQLGTAQVAVGDLASVKEGDVILVSQPHSEPLVLFGLESDVKVFGHLGRHDGQRAVQVCVQSEGAGA